MDLVKKYTIIHRVNTSVQNLLVIKEVHLFRLNSIEPLVVRIPLERDAVSNPMHVSEGIAIVNSMIEGNKIRYDLMHYRKITK